MEQPLVIATWGLVVATLLLGVVSCFQYRSITSQARATEKRDLQQMAVLERKADALADSAKASQSMADEMLEARRAASPLRLRVELDESPVSGSFAASLVNDGDRAEVIVRSEILVGSHVVEPTNWANLYLEPRGSYPLLSLFEVGRADLLTLRVTGHARDGVLQTREFLFRIKPDGTLQDLDHPRPEPPLVAWR
jgi:hypothetical protein